MPAVRAADHYAARVAGLLPEDPVAALAADEAYYFVIQDIHNAVRAMHCGGQRPLAGYQADLPPH